MKRVSSVLRFCLLMIGSVFFALGLLIINACRSTHGKAKALIRPEKPATARTNAAEVAGLAGLTTDQLIGKLDAADYREREAAQQALIQRGQDVVPKVGAAASSANPEVRLRARAILGVLGWHVTRDGKVEKMSESKEFKQMMRKRLPEFQAE